jgi:hypothetical protein
MRSTDKEKLEEMTLAIELWQESGLSQRVYCEQEGYTISKFKYWVKKLERMKNTPSSKKPVSPKIKVPVFLPVEISKKEEASSLSSLTMEIHYPNGVKIVCSDDLDNLKLQTLIQAF